MCLFNTKDRGRCGHKIGRGRVSDEILNELRNILDDLNKYIAGKGTEYYDEKIKRLGEIVGCEQHNTNPAETRVLNYLKNFIGS